jgi:hypothetical protein
MEEITSLGVLSEVFVLLVSRERPCAAWAAFYRQLRWATIYFFYLT